MDAVQLTGGFADAPRDAAQAFRAAMTAMARPGTIHQVAGAVGPAPLSGAASVLILTLCDVETPLYLGPSHDTGAVRDWITFHTGAPLVEASEAMFAVGSWEALAPVGRFGIGTDQYPDRAAILIVEMADLVPEGTVLTGPGIAHEARLSVPDVAFSQANARLFPLGLDLFLTCGARLAALPRTTRVR